MQQKPQSNCPHFQRILLQRSIPQVHQSLSRLFVSITIQQETLHKSKQIKCDTCSKKLEYTSICLKCEKPLCDIEKTCAGEHLKLNGVEHCVVINLYSTLICCLICKIEIYDFEQTQCIDEEQIMDETNNPQKIRMEYHKYFYKQDFTPIKQHQAVKHAAMLNLTNNSHLNCVLQIILNFSVIQNILTKINQEYQSMEYNLKSNRKSILRELCSIAAIFSQKSFRIINPSTLIKHVACLDQKLIGYSRKDAYDSFKIIINFLNEEFKFTNSTIYSKNEIVQANKSNGHDWNIIADPSSYMDYSFIQSIFSGELVSTLQCLNCSKQTKAIEQFSALSLEIPDQKEQGFFQQLVNNVQNNKNSITLQECLDYFYEPVIDQSTLCTCGARQGKRQYSFKKQPNLLCIHLQRFLNRNLKDTKHISFPIQDYNFQSYFNLNNEQIYRLYGVIVHLNNQGGDHYETILRQNNSTFISIKDENIQYVTQKYVEDSNALLLFYERVEKIDVFKEGLKKNLTNQHQLISQQELVFKDEDLCYLPHFWYDQFMYLAKPPMVMTSHLLCPHNLLKPDYWDFRVEYENAKTAQFGTLDSNASFITIGEQQLSNSPAAQQDSSAKRQLELSSIVIPKAVCEFVIEKFGGGPVISKTIKTCTACIELAQLMSKRRKLERQLILKYENIPGFERVFLIHEEWLKKWQNYLYNSKVSLQKNCIFGLPPPDEISNTSLLDKDQQFIQSKKESMHFSMISAPVWNILIELYGGGPTIQIGSQQFQQEPFKLTPDDHMQIKEMRQLFTNCVTQCQVTKYLKEKA